ncbi:hypothetical protein J5491_04105 [Candidatus Saccharibacteria bacterium]|nr:hypothetical protein [Candidatus Saccharibacteria bacterium]
MDQKKPLTTNPLMRKKQEKESASDPFDALKNQSDNELADNKPVESAAFENSAAKTQPITTRPATTPTVERRAARRPLRSLPETQNRRRSLGMDIRRRPVRKAPMHGRPVRVPTPTRPRPVVEPTGEITTRELETQNCVTDTTIAAERNNATNITPKGQKKTHKKLSQILFAIIAFVSVAVVVAIILIKVVPHDNSSDSSDSSASNDTRFASSGSPSVFSDITTEKNESVTKETINNAAEIEFLGVQKSETMDLDHKIVKVSIKNKTNERQSIRIIVSAIGEDGQILDTSSLYAEGMYPDDVFTFEAFVSTTLSDEDLEKATFKTSSASTYQTQIDSEESDQ